MIWFDLYVFEWNVRSALSQIEKQAFDYCGKNKPMHRIAKHNDMLYTYRICYVYRMNIPNRVLTKRWRSFKISYHCSNNKSLFSFDLVNWSILSGKKICFHPLFGCHKMKAGEISMANDILNGKSLRRKDVSGNIQCTYIQTADSPTFKVKWLHMQLTKS